MTINEHLKRNYGSVLLDIMNTSEQNQHDTCQTCAVQKETKDLEVLCNHSEQHPASTPKLDPTKNYSVEEMETILCERQVVDMNDEMMDPIEWTIRTILPIPAAYYWEVFEERTNDENLQLWKKELYTKIPTYIKIWHTTIFTLDNIQNWTNRSIAQPIASMTGLTGSRFYYITDTMTKDDIERSKRYVQRRLEKEKSIASGKLV